MDDDAGVRILVDMIFEKQVINAEGMIARNPSIPTCMLTEDFSKRMQGVLLIRSWITACRWLNFFDTCYKKMLSSHEMYLRFVMFACISEHKCQQNIFESFISVCSLVKLVCVETLQKTGLNFSDLNTDIFTVFYRCQLKRIFCRRGGFRRLVEYIRDHRYLTWKLNKNYPVPPKDPNVLVEAIETELNEKIKKELTRDRIVVKETNPDEVTRDTTSGVLAKAVLSITLVQLPTLPSYLDLLKSMIAYREKEMVKNSQEKRRTEAAEKLEVSNVALHGCSDSNSKSKTNYDAKHQENIEWYENIIQAVIRHNHSKSSGHENANNRIQEETDGVLEHLKDTIKSLIEVLDEYNNE